MAVSAPRDGPESRRERERERERDLSAHASRMREKSPIFVKPKLSITPIIAISEHVDNRRVLN